MEDLKCHLNLLKFEPHSAGIEEAMSAPIFSMPVLRHAESISGKNGQEPYPQYGLLAGTTQELYAISTSDGNPNLSSAKDPRIFFNVAAPSSTFICGSQGSGKSHTLSCMLENCLLPSSAALLPKPLAGLVFHYDTFICDDGGSPCEAAFLATASKIQVQVLCAPTNLHTMQQTYGPLGIKVKPLQIKESDLNTKRMLDLMAVSTDDGPMPLYLHTVYRILRNMRMEQQMTGKGFSYVKFKQLLLETTMTPGQLAPLNQRLEMLESFMPMDETVVPLKKGKNKLLKKDTSDFLNKSGSLIIVDLSCPCVTPEGACALFNICLSIFLENKTATGRVVALDEAHKYMNASAEANTLTATLLSAVRLQRHLGARIIISTQEPTILPSLLDLCSITIVHRFTSPQWFCTLKEHLVAVASDFVDQKPDSENKPGEPEKGPVSGSREDLHKQILGDIVRLSVGEALLFAPSGLVGVRKGADGSLTMEKLGAGYLKVRVRQLLTQDGGKSEMAV